MLKPNYSMKNFKKIMDHNMHNVEEEGFYMGLNHFADLTEAEFKAHTGRKAKPAGENKQYTTLPTLGLPDSVNWYTAGKVNGPKDQGSCGSCWAFSAVGAIEGVHAIASGQLLNLAEQQLVDCSHEGPKGEPNDGCDGGWEDYAIDYATTHKLELGMDDSDTHRDGSCKYNAALGKV